MPRGMRKGKVCANGSASRWAAVSVRFPMDRKENADSGTRAAAVRLRGERARRRGSDAARYARGEGLRERKCGGRTPRGMREGKGCANGSAAAGCRAVCARGRPARTEVRRPDAARYARGEGLCEWKCGGRTPRGMREGKGCAAQARRLAKRGICAEKEGRERILFLSRPWRFRRVLRGVSPSFPCACCAGRGLPRRGIHSRTCRGSRRSGGRRG